MIALFVCVVYSLQLPLLGFFALALSIAVPFVVYRMIRRDYLRYPNMQFFSALWMHGISIFIFASMILAVAIYVFLRFIEPDFIINNLYTAIGVYRSLGVAEATDVANSLQLIIDKHMVPSASTFAVSSIWTVVFSGSMLSLLLALLVRTFNKNKNEFHY
jgi:thiol:disulfide interchange protein